MSSCWKLLEGLDWLVPVPVGMHERAKSGQGSQQCMKYAIYDNAEQYISTAYSGEQQFTPEGSAYPSGARQRCSHASSTSLLNKTVTVTLCPTEEADDQQPSRWGRGYRQTAGGERHKEAKQWWKDREDRADEEPNGSKWELKNKAGEKEHWILGPGAGKNWHQNQQLYFSMKASLG